jgi:hypothetical protein
MTNRSAENSFAAHVTAVRGFPLAIWTVAFVPTAASMATILNFASAASDAANSSSRYRPAAPAFGVGRDLRFTWLAAIEYT